MTVLNLSNKSQVQQQPHVVVGAEEIQANCWQKATLQVSLFSCFENFGTLQLHLSYLPTQMQSFW